MGMGLLLTIIGMCVVFAAAAFNEWRLGRLPQSGGKR